MRANPANIPNLRLLLKQFLTDSSGATAIEYAMIASGVSIAIVGAVWNLGSTIQTTLYAKIAAALK
jgi:pilus assembly protein Flp/PilA